MERTEQLRMREVHLALPLTTDAICGLELGDTVFLSGVLFTGREGFYQRVFEQKLEPPLDRGSLPDRLSPTRGYLFDHRRLRPGAIYGQGIRQVKDVFWKDELSLAQAVWVLEMEHFGPFLVEYDVQGRSLFGLANAEVNETLGPLDEGLPQPALKRLGEVIVPMEEVL